MGSWPCELASPVQVALGAMAFSKDGNLLTYSISRDSSDWQELIVFGLICLCRLL